MKRGNGESREKRDGKESSYGEQVTYSILQGTQSQCLTTGAINIYFTCADVMPRASVRLSSTHVLIMGVLWHVKKKARRNGC